MTRTLRVLAIVCLSLGLAGIQVLPAHAATQTLTVTDCSNDTQLQADVTTANGDTGDTINFACSGTIPLTSQVHITSTMTIDGSGQTVAIDGGHSTGLIYAEALSSEAVILTLDDLTLQNGSYGNGGAIEVDVNTTVNINNSSLLDNTSDQEGGAIFADGDVNITNSTFSGNTADVEGGAIWNEVATITVSNSTFYDNSGPCAGAICNYETLIVTNSTFSDNSSPTIGANVGCGAAICNFYQATLGGDIFANSTTGVDCANPYGGTVIDEGYNLDDNSADTCGFSPANHDIIGLNPDLGPLADNGGPTQTMALLPGSPAIDYIPVGDPNNLCPLTGGTDQRGDPRPDANESTCDIGAYEYQDTEFPTPNGQNAFDIESSNWYCASGGTACVPSGSVAGDCTTLAPCPGASYADAEAFGRPNNTTNGVPDELVLACLHGTNTGYDIGYLDVVSTQGNTDFPGGVYGYADTGAIGGKGTLIGGDGSEANPSQTSSISASAYDLVTGVRGSVTGTQNTDNATNRLNNGSLRVTITGTLWHVSLGGTSTLYSPYTGTMSCTVGGSHAYDLLNAGLDTNALAEGEYENAVGDNAFLQSFAPRAAS